MHNIWKPTIQTYTNTVACTTSDTQVQVSFSALGLDVAHGSRLYTCCTEEQGQYHKHTAKHPTSPQPYPLSLALSLSLSRSHTNTPQIHVPHCCVMVFLSQHKAPQDANCIERLSRQMFVTEELKKTKKTWTCPPVFPHSTHQGCFLRPWVCVWNKKIMLKN